MIKRLRAWTDAVETFVREVLLGQRRGNLAALGRVALFFLSRLFARAVKTRYLLRDRH
jgi:hypothetical protein